MNAVAKALVSGMHCAECKRAFTATFTSTGKLVLQHAIDAACINSGRRFEPPTVKLQEVKN